MNIQKKTDEIIRLSPFELDGVPMLDMRFWHSTKFGPRPTKRGFSFNQNMITRLIMGLQKVQQQLNSEAAKEEASVNG